MLDRAPNHHRALLESTAGARMVLVASTGGHLSQAVRWYDRFRWSDESLFITFESEQSLSLIGNRPHFFVPYVAPRAVGAGLRALVQLGRVDLRGYHAMVSTGAGFAIAAVPHALRAGLPFLYLESMSRSAGPSVTGRVLEHVPWVHRFSQYESYPPRRWTPVSPLLADYHSTPRGTGEITTRRIFVTLGTIAPYRFDRMIDAVCARLRPDDEVVWQLGVTVRTGLPGTVTDYVSGEDFTRLVTWADVVITHAGIGTLVAVLEAGKLPVTMARLSTFQEHVDDHQEQARDRLVSLGLAVDLTDRSVDALATAASSVVERG